MIPVIDSYKSNGENGRPSTDINPKEKGDKYGLAWSKFIYGLYCSNQTSWGNTDANRFNTNRLYSRGEQPTDQYKNFLLNEVNDTSDSTTSVTSWDDVQSTARSRRMGWSNINWKNLSPGPSIMNNLHGQFDKMDFDLYVNTIDADSRGLAEDEKYRRMVEAKFSDWQIEYKKNAGIPIDQEVPYPMTPEEFDMFEAEDGFKLAIATTMQKLVRYSFEISRWDNVVRKKVIDDLICLGYAAVRDYYSTTEKKWKVKYLDPAYLVAQYSNEYDYHDSEYFGYLHKDWTISNLRNKLPDLSEEDIRALAFKVFGKYNNPSTGWDTKYSKLDPSTNTYRCIDDFKVPVFEAAWMDFDLEKNLYYRNRHGRDLVIPLGYDGEVKPISEKSKSYGATQDVKTIGVKVPRECYWVLDSDYTFDCGIIKMADRKSLSEPKLPFHVEQLLQPPIIENLIPILDEVTQLYLKFQNSLAMMAERGYAINVAMLGNVNYGADTMPIQDVVKMWHQTGRLLYSYVNGSGVQGMYGGAATPITPIEGGMGTIVTDTIQAMEFAFRKIELFVGVNLASLGITPEVGVPTSTTKEAMQSTMNALKPIVDAALEIKQSAGESLMRRIQVGIRNSQEVRDAYTGVVSPTDIEEVRLMEKNSVEYGLTLKPKPDSMMKAQFNKWLDIALQDTRDGNAGIFTSDAMYFTARLEAGEDILDLIKQVRYRIKKNREQKEQSDMAKINQQTQGNEQNEQQKHANEMEKIQAEGQVKVTEEALRGQIKDKQSNKKMIASLYDDLRKEADMEKGLMTNTGGR
jgi:hypothetical protein